MYIYTYLKLSYNCIIMENSENKLTTDEKAEIFEYVNDKYLKLKGQKKKQTKASFKGSWKEDNLLYIMMMKLNDVYDIWCDNEQHEEWVWEKENTYMEGTITQKKHRRMMNMMRQNEYDLEIKLEEIEAGKGYMSEEKYKEDMREKEKEYEQNNREQGDRVAKYRNEADFLREKLDKATKRLDAQKLYYEDQMTKLNSD